jgi:hypothetical protein
MLCYATLRYLCLIECGHEIVELFGEFLSKCGLLAESASRALFHLCEPALEHLEPRGRQQSDGVIVELILALLEEGRALVANITGVVLDNESGGRRTLGGEIRVLPVIVEQLIEPGLVAALGHSELFVDRGQHAERSILDQVQHGLIIDVVNVLELNLLELIEKLLLTERVGQEKLLKLLIREILKEKKKSKKTDQEDR